MNRGLRRDEGSGRTAGVDVERVTFERLLETRVFKKEGYRNRFCEANAKSRVGQFAMPASETVVWIKTRISFSFWGRTESPKRQRGRAAR
ncbi:MAG: hypothetical protein DMG06_03210 [Acidobacteria bacterium]|nr:MAG: hypothetical protein DMG06_03210 [Acidobacteriota bacterium]